MATTTEPITQSKRIESVDALRGFALMGILLLHCIEHFNWYYFPEATTQPAWLNSIDTYIWDSLFLLFGGKAYAIFAVLFGFTFHLMMEKQRKRGRDFGKRFLWRMVLLAAFAFLNGAFFPGEVLLMYSILAISLFAVRNMRSDDALLIAIFFLAQPLDWIRTFQAFFDANYVLPVNSMNTLWASISEGQKSTSFLTLLKNNTLYGHKGSLVWAYTVGRMSQTIGLFIMGYLLGKSKRFELTKKNNVFWLRILGMSTIVFLTFYTLENNLTLIIENKPLKTVFFRVVDMYGNLGFTFLLISSFLLLYNKSVFRKATHFLSYMGKMSLTVYILQSVVGGALFFNYGLGLGPKLLHTKSFLLGCILVVLFSLFCRWWMNRFNQGPLEQIWHKLTYWGMKEKEGEKSVSNEDSECKKQAVM